MNRINCLKRFFLAALTLLPCMLAADHIIVENDLGEAIILPVYPDDTVIDVIDILQTLSEENAIHESEGYFNLKVAKSLVLNDKIAKKPRVIARSYAAGITPQESADIAYILRTIANKSLPDVAAASSSLRKIEDRINHVHPFFFLATIFTNEELKVCVRNLKGKMGVWNGFLDGIVPSLAEEHARDNVLPFVDDFAARINVDPNVIRPILQAGKWERFVKTLIEIVPRNPGSDRYDM